MKRLAASLLALALAASAGAALADPAPKLATDRDADGRPLPFGRPAYFPGSTPMGSGPFKAVMAEDPGLPDHTLYYPANLAAAGKLPVVVWGNGACINAGNRFRIMLTEIASHGFLVIAGGPVANVKYEVGPQENPAVPAPGAAPAAPPPPSANPPPPPRPGDAVGRNTAEQMIAGLDWAEKANRDPASKFYGRLDTAQMAAAGQSCGGGLTTTVAADRRIKTAIIYSGAPGAAVTNPPNAAAGAPTPRQRVDAWHAPVLILAGDAQRDIAHSRSVETYDYLSKVPVFFAWQDGLTHIGTYGMPGGGELGRLGWQWLAWRLKGDAQAGRVFSGADCGLCRSPDGWHVFRKGIN